MEAEAEAIGVEVEAESEAHIPDFKATALCNASEHYCQNFSKDDYLDMYEW